MRIRIVDRSAGYCPPPTINEMLQYDLVELHEAVCTLICCWPEYIVKSNCEDMAKRKKVSRTCFFEPAPPPSHPKPLDWRFSPNEMGPAFCTVYNAMREDMARGKLAPDRTEDLGICTVYGGWKKKESYESFQGEWISYLFSPSKVIHWARLRGIDIPEELQAATGVLLMTGKRNRSTLNNVKIKIIGQFLKHHFPGQRTSYYLRHAWLKSHIDGHPGADPADESDRYDGPGDKAQIARRALNELRDPCPKRKQGNRSREDVAKEPYHPKAIEEVICKEPSGIPRYDIPLLRIAMETAANVLLGKYLEDSARFEELPSTITLEQFLASFMAHEVVALYTNGAPSDVLGYIRMFAASTVAHYFEALEQGSFA